MMQNEFKIIQVNPYYQTIQSTVYGCIKYKYKYIESIAKLDSSQTNRMTVIRET